MARYQCIRECRFKHKNFKVGQIVNVGKPEEDLPHDKEGKLRHFVPSGQFSEDLVKETEIQDRLEKAKNRAQIKAEKRKEAKE